MLLIKVNKKQSDVNKDPSSIYRYRLQSYCVDTWYVYNYCFMNTIDIVNFRVTYIKSEYFNIRLLIFLFKITIKLWNIFKITSLISIYIRCLLIYTQIYFRVYSWIIMYIVSNYIYLHTVSVIWYHR